MPSKLSVFLSTWVFLLPKNFVSSPLPSTFPLFSSFFLQWSPFCPSCIPSEATALSDIKRDYLIPDNVELRPVLKIYSKILANALRLLLQHIAAVWTVQSKEPWTVFSSPRTYTIQITLNCTIQRTLNCLFLTEDLYNPKNPELSFLFCHGCLLSVIAHSPFNKVVITCTPRVLDFLQRIVVRGPLDFFPFGGWHDLFLARF